MDVFIHKALTAVKLSLDALNAVPADTWYLAGAIIASGITASVVVAYVNYRRKFETAEKLAKHVVGYLLVLLSSGFAIVDYYLTNAKGFAPFFGSTAPAIYAAATAVYQFGGSKVYQQVAGTLMQWANDKTTPKKSIFSTSPKLATPAVADTPAESDSIFS